MVAGVYYCVVIHLNDLCWIRNVCVLLWMINVLVKEFTHEHPEWVKAEAAGIGSIGKECPQMLEGTLYVCIEAVSCLLDIHLRSVYI